MDNIEKFLKALKKDHKKLQELNSKIQKYDFEVGVLNARVCTLQCLIDFMRMYDQDPAVSLGILRSKVDESQECLRQVRNMDLSYQSMINDLADRIAALEDKHPIRNRICKLLDKILNK